jgi:hypothetical protein
MLSLSEHEDRANSQHCCSSDDEEGYEERRNAARRKRRQGLSEGETVGEPNPSGRKKPARKKAPKKSKTSAAAVDPMKSSKEPNLAFNSDMTPLMQGSDLTRLWGSMSQCFALALGILYVDHHVPSQFFSSLRLN